MKPTFRYTVARPGTPPLEVQSFDHRQSALQFAKDEVAAGRTAETWDWRTNAVIDGVAA